MDWTEKKAREAEATLRKWRKVTDGVEVGIPSIGVINALTDDVNTHGAITVCQLLYSTHDFPALKASAQLLGLLAPEMGDWAKSADDRGIISDDIREIIANAVLKRHNAKLQKDFATSDNIRDLLTDAGVILHDQKDKPAQWEIPTDVDVLKLEALK